VKSISPLAKRWARDLATANAIKKMNSGGAKATPLAAARTALECAGTP